MSPRWTLDEREAVLRRGHLWQVPGLRGAAVATGVKPSGRPDLLIVQADAPRHVASVFTTCAAAAAPVTLGRQMRAEGRLARTIVVNSGNANALTGPDGLRHAEAMRHAAEVACGGPAWVLSTGVIGQPLPVDRVCAGIAAAAEQLDTRAGPELADAILTTDTVRKHAGTTVGPWTIGGIAKGSGMIHPDMATMLAVIATDAPIATSTLPAILRHAVDESFHSITVDGDTSTNDTVLLLASPGDPLPPEEHAAVVGAIGDVARSLALQIVEDGEGVSRLLDIEVEGASSDQDARRVGRSIARSSLVKTALAGGDPNWGRILAAAGNAGVPTDPSRWTLWIGGHVVFQDGAPCAADAHVLSDVFTQPRVPLRIRIGSGDGASRTVTTDLTHDYVSINADYTT